MDGRAGRAGKTLGTEAGLAAILAVMTSLFGGERDTTLKLMHIEQIVISKFFNSSDFGLELSDSRSKMFLNK